METNSYAAAREALEAVTAARRSLADRVYTPWWYHSALGLLLAASVLGCGGVILGQYGYLLTFAVVLGSFGPMKLYTRITGVQLTSASASLVGRAAAWMLWGMVAAYGVGCLAAFILARDLGWTWVAWVAAGEVFVAAIVFGRAYDYQLRRHLRSENA
ncbi:hypothetical protein JT358_00450 [Micrococcales bacterium 31B]|nr:hypothetical protein [Micrococcales bacterium 31B]